MIELTNVTKYYVTRGRRRTIIEGASLRFETGLSYGILGSNGSGKSTLVRLLAGTEPANRGRIRRDVRVSWPLGFGGFHPQLTGRENVSFVAKIYGADTRRVIEFVEDFAELGEYLSLPVRTYSSGMNARLAFGLSLAIDFDLYLIDEITSVGDARLQQRCREIFAARRKVSDVIVVSHNPATVKDYCTKGAVLANGRLRLYDHIDDAIAVYKKINA